MAKNTIQATADLWVLRRCQRLKAGQKVENMKIPRIKKLLPLTKMQKRKLVGHKRGTNKNVAPITLRGKVKTAQYSTK